MSEVSLSIITPLLNGIQFIEACIKNVIEQQCPSAEHIIIDGGSTDGTVDVIRLYDERYPHIRWISEKDEGQSDAMNKGIAMAKGPVLGFLNVDDFYEPETLKFVVELFRLLPEPSLIIGNCNVWGDNGKILWINKPAYLEISQLLTGIESRYPFPVNPSAYFYHKSLHNLIGAYDIDEHYAMDIDFMLKTTMKLKPVYVDKTLGNYRYAAGTKTFEDMRRDSSNKRFKNILNSYRDKLSLTNKLRLFYYIIIGKLR